MTRKDYELITEAVRDGYRFWRTINSRGWNATVRVAADAAIRDVVGELAIALYRDNPHFDAQRFVDACGFDAQTFSDRVRERSGMSNNN